MVKRTFDLGEVGRKVKVTWRKQIGEETKELN